MKTSTGPAELPAVLIVAANVSSKFGGEAFLPLKYFQLMRARGYPVKLITHPQPGLLGAAAAFAQQHLGDHVE